MVKKYIVKIYDKYLQPILAHIYEENTFDNKPIKGSIIILKGFKITLRFGMKQLSGWNFIIDNDFDIRETSKLDLWRRKYNITPNDLKRKY